MRRKGIVITILPNLTKENKRVSKRTNKLFYMSYPNKHPVPSSVIEYEQFPSK